MENISVDVFEIVSGSVIISDPGFERGYDGQSQLPNVKRGTWHARARRIPDPDFKGQMDVSMLSVYHEDVGNPDLVADWMPGGTIGVDSGQAGVFDASVYASGGEYDDSWYEVCCKAKGEMHAGVVNGGANASSGYGDGTYNYYYAVNEFDQVVAVEIVFIPDDDEDED